MLNGVLTRFTGQKDVTQRLHEAHRSLATQEEESHRAERDKRSLEEEVGHLKTSLQAAQAESKALQVGTVPATENMLCILIGYYNSVANPQDKLKLLQGFESRANADKHKLKESLEAAESRVNCLELSQRGLEGELHRAQLRVAELDAEAATLQERLSDMRKKTGDHEDRRAALQVSEERLSAALARAEQHESRLREQLHKVTDSLSDTRAEAGALQREVTQLRRALSASEQERRLLQVQLIT